MKKLVSLKPIDKQVIVITGATSGIGLCTVRLAVEKGAAVVLFARNQQQLKILADEIRSQGGRASFATGDVSNQKDIEALVEVALRDFGSVDTWINNAGVSVYGRLDEVPIEEMRRIMDVNFWGSVYGSLAAIPILKSKGGAIINIGSTLSERAIPLQGIYGASKHALKAFTDSLRMELEKAGTPISVTLIKPGAINTPYTHHARSHLGVEPTNPPPIYDPKIVAHSILECAQRPIRDLFVGGGGKLFSLMENWAPRFTDKYMEQTLFDQQKTDQKIGPNRTDSLFEPPETEGRERGDYSGHTFQSSLYTSSALHPWRTLAVAAGFIAAASLALRKRQQRRNYLPFH